MTDSAPCARYTGDARSHPAPNFGGGRGGALRPLQDAAARTRAFRRAPCPEPRRKRRVGGSCSGLKFVSEKTNEKVVYRRALTASFRTPRTVGRLASPLVNSADFRAIGETKSRQSPTANTEDLEKKGRFYLLQVPQGTDVADVLVEATSGIGEGTDQKHQIVVLAENPSHITAIKASPVLDAMDIVEAKGSEWDSVVVLGIYPMGLGDYDERSRTYTRMTRTRTNLMVIAAAGPEHKDDAVFRRWLTLRASDLETETSTEILTDVNGLRRVLQQHFFQAVTAEDLVSRLQQVLDFAVENADEFPSRALDLIQRLAAGGGLRQLPVLLDDYLLAQPQWEPELRALGNAGTPAERVSVHIALGDFGRARAAARLTPELLELATELDTQIQHGGTLLQALVELAESGPEDASLTALVGSALAVRVVNALEENERAELRSLPEWREEEQRPSGIAPRVRKLAMDVRARWTESLKATMAEVFRLGDAEGEAEAAALVTHAEKAFPRTRAAEIEARLFRIAGQRQGA